MDVSAIVAVFPNAYSRKRVALLTRNVKSMLHTRSLKFNSIKKDGDVIVVDAHDPVFASSSIGLLFGTEQIVIARRTGTKMQELVDAISFTATSLLLKGERFIVKIGGKTSGYLASDAELAATSAIISSSLIGARPGTVSSHDRVIYAHVAKTNSYVAIFSDKGRGGMVFGAHKHKIICPVYDELSGLAMLETLRQGYDIFPLVLYSTDAARIRLVKLVCKIVSSIPRAKTSAEFVHISPTRGETLANLAIKTAITSAKSLHLERICVPLSPLIHDMTLSDSLISLIHSASMTYIVPLSGIESRLGTYCKFVGIAPIIDKLENFRLQPARTKRTTKELCKIKLELRLSPNMLHDTLNLIANGC